ncbi:MAG: 50S ribosomal protein L25 [Chloroflexi bacterium]|nr:50S ribosomal protein L25 [Chloroflexota bacterium]
MSEQIVLEASKREVIGKQVKKLRSEGKLPAVVYGHGIEPTPISLHLHETAKILRKAGSSTFITLKVDGDDHSVLVRETQKGIISRQYIHVDFQVIAMDQLVRAQVQLVFNTDDVPAALEFGAMIVTGLDALDIESLPKDLPEQIYIDATVLENIGDNIMVRDLDLPDTLTVYDDLETMIVAAVAPTAVVEEEEVVDEELLEMELGADEPEVIEKGRAEDEAGDE